VLRSGEDFVLCVQLRDKKVVGVFVPFFVSRYLWDDVESAATIGYRGSTAELVCFLQWRTKARK
jgi:hypothetical protein